MKTSAWIGAAAVAAASMAFAAGRVTAGEDEKPAQPTTVKALRYRPRLVESAMDWAHGGGVECDQLWFPDRKVVANVTTETTHDTGRSVSRPVMHAYFGEANTKQYDLATKTTRDLPTEEIQVPAQLAQHIFDLAELTKRQGTMAHEFADEGVKSGVFREKAPAPEPPK